MSPGLDFAIVTKNAFQRGARAGLWTACGVGVGLMVHFAYTALFLGSVIKGMGPVLVAVQILGALFLLYVGITILKGLLIQGAHTGKPDQGQKSQSLLQGHPWLQGFLVNVLNPKVGLLSISLFTSYLQKHPAYMMYVLFGVFVLITIGWFSLVALCWTRPGFSAFYQRHQRKMDALMGLFFLFLAGQILFQIARG